MILSDREIKLSLKRDHIRITPPPPDSAVSSTSVDLTLDEEISFWNPPPGTAAEPVVIYPHNPKFDPVVLLRQHGTTLLMPPTGFVLNPGAFILGWTAEQICLPYTSRLAARVEGRSSLARLGVGVHVTAPTIHAGFGFTNDPGYPGTRIRLEIWNCGPLAVCLEKGMRVCQMILEEVHGTPDKGYEGAFATQAPETPGPPTASRSRARRQRPRR
ncbi:MAG TPA: dCTP deaminase [Gemmataceae bacterium]|nr:dCTP deaminase [Gemmataceae bacterium]